MARLTGWAHRDADRVALRARAIEWYLPIAVYLARRFAGRGEPQTDLTQVAVVGLIKAVDSFDATHGVPFPSYAIPTISANSNAISATPPGTCGCRDACRN